MATADEDLVALWDAPVRRRRRPAPDWLTYQLPAYTKTVSQRLTLAQTKKARGSAIAGELPRGAVVTFARAPDGNVHMATGLTPVIKWDGLDPSAKTVGVPAPTTALTLAGSGSGTITGTYTAYVRFLDADGRPSNLSPLSTAVTLTSKGQIDYTAIPTPTDPKVVRRQILRNTAGQTLTYYVDVDATDVMVTTATSTRTDATLATQTAVALFDGQGSSLASRFAIPRADKPIITAYLDRMFAAGEIPYSEGMAEVTIGSATVTGIGTQWTSSFVGRYFYGVGVSRSYLISAVNTDTQTLTLSVNWQEATDAFAVYSIRSAPAERRNIYFTEAGQYEAWPATNGLTVEENGDEVTGLMVADSFLFILMRRHIYRLTYHLGPTVDGGIFLSAHRGCVNHRCWVYLDGYAYMLDEQGIYRFKGAGDAEQLSGPVQDLFWIDHQKGDLRINWNAQKYFHAIHARDETTIRWFVALSGNRLPRHALCYNYVANSWWLEEFAWTVASSVLAEADTPRPLVAGPAARLFAMGVGNLDGPNADAGQTYGTSDTNGLLKLGDTRLTYPTAGVAGSPVYLVKGRGKGQTNVIASVSGTALTLVRPWKIKPDSTSVFQIGGFPWRWVSHWMRWFVGDEEKEQQRRVELLFQPCKAAGTANLRLYKDYAETPENWGVNWPPTAAESDGVTTTKDDPDAEIDVTTATGFAQKLMPGHRDRYIQKADLVQLELKGSAAAKPLTISEVNVEGAV